MKDRALYAWICVAGLLFVALSVMAHLQTRFFFDLPATLFLQAHRAPWLDALMKAVSWPGYFPEFVPMFALVVALMLLAGWRREAAIMAGAEAVVGIIGFALKALVARPRPPDSLVWVNDHLSDPFTFTAGHVHTFMVVYGWIAYLALTRMRRSALSAGLAAACVAVLLLEGLSRVYLGDHWSSDVLGAYLLGGICLAGEIAVHRRLGGPAPQPESGTRSRRTATRRRGARRQARTQQA